MTQASMETLIRDYLAAWSERDPTKRRVLLESVWDADGIYTDPISLLPGRDTLDQAIATLLANNPNAVFTLAGAVDQHHQYLRFSWTLRTEGGQEVLGMDFGELSADGKLIKIVGFY
jgi:hypothetical protein